MVQPIAVLSKFIERLFLNRHASLAADVVDDPHDRQTRDILLNRRDRACAKRENRNQRNGRFCACSKFTAGSTLAPGKTEKRTIEKRTAGKTLTLYAHD